MAQGERSAATIVEGMADHLAAAGIEAIDYVALVDPDSLVAVEAVRSTTLAAVAARIGRARLIDNTLLKPAGSSSD